MKIRTSFAAFFVLFFVLAIPARGQFAPSFGFYPARSNDVGDARPFVLPDGSTYRDLKTIDSSRAVAKFAVNYDSSERQTIRDGKRISQLEGTGIQETHFVSEDRAPFGRFRSLQRNEIPEIDYSRSRRIRLPEDLKVQRQAADREEVRLLLERDSQNAVSDALSRTHLAGAIRAENFRNRPGNHFSTGTVEPESIRGLPPVGPALLVHPAPDSHHIYQPVLPVSPEGPGYSYNIGYGAQEVATPPSWPTPFSAGSSSYSSFSGSTSSGGVNYGYSVAHDF